MLWSILECSSYEVNKHIDNGFEDSYNYLFYNCFLSGKISARIFKLSIFLLQNDPSDINHTFSWDLITRCSWYL